MKLEFQAKFLQYLNQRKKQDEGFTLIELLVVIIIIGILAAIALPSLLSQVNKGKQAEARQNVGALNRAQQAYYLENGAFVNQTTNLAQLGVGIKTQTVNYKYTITGQAGTDPQFASNQAAAYVSQTLRSYVGLNATAIGDKVTSEVLTIGYVCESNVPTKTPAAGAAGTTACESLGGVGWKSLGSK
jgi:type IV pilus assembly protein PilA